MELIRGAVVTVEMKCLQGILMATCRVLSHGPSSESWDPSGMAKYAGGAAWVVGVICNHSVKEGIRYIHCSWHCLLIVPGYYYTLICTEEKVLTVTSVQGLSVHPVMHMCVFVEIREVYWRGNWWLGSVPQVSWRAKVINRSTPFKPSYWSC